jgi:uncharacterized protein (DUF433 family)
VTCWRATASNARPSPGRAPAPFEFQSASGVYTELQCGSYFFMDADDGRNRDRYGRPTKAFEPGLFVWATVMSRPTDDRAIVDAGLKALAFDSGPPLVCDEPAATYERASDEHGRLGIAGATNRLGSATRSASSPAIATRPSTSTTGTSPSAATASSSSGPLPREVRCIDRSAAMMTLEQIVHRDPEILGGTSVFRGTRVPIRSLFDYLEGGETLDEFLRQFPSVRREQAIALLDLARETLAADAPSA